MLRYVTVQDTAAVMRDNKEAVKDPKGERRHRKKVHCGDCFAVIAQEGFPPLGWFWISGSFSHPSQDTPLGYFKAQHLQLAMDPRSSPGPVLSHHAKDQIPEFFAHAFFTYRHLMA